MMIKINIIMAKKKRQIKLIIWRHMSKRRENKWEQERYTCMIKVMNENVWWYIKRGEEEMKNHDWWTWENKRHTGVMSVKRRKWNKCNGACKTNWESKSKWESVNKKYIINIYINYTYIEVWWKKRICWMYNNKFFMNKQSDQLGK